MVATWVVSHSRLHKDCWCMGTQSYVWRTAEIAWTPVFYFCAIGADKQHEQRWAVSYPLCKKKRASTSRPLDKQKIATTNPPNMAFTCLSLVLWGIQDQGVIFLAFFSFHFFNKQLNHGFCWERLTQPIESLYLWHITVLLTATTMAFWIIPSRLPSSKAQAEACMDNIYDNNAE